MKGLTLLVILAVILNCVEAKLKIGSCTFKEEALRKRQCYTSFIQDLQKNPKSGCSTELNTYIDCYIRHVGKVCFPDLKESWLRLIIELKKDTIKEEMCNKAGLQIPSSLHSSNLAKMFNGCSAKLVKMWQINRADPMACTEYQRTKECLLKMLKDLKDLKSDDINELTQLFSGSYNPFCPNSIDPTSKAVPTSVPTRVHPSSTTSTTSTQATHTNSTRSTLSNRVEPTSTRTHRSLQTSINLTSFTTDRSSLSIRKNEQRRTDQTSNARRISLPKGRIIVLLILFCIVYSNGSL